MSYSEVRRNCPECGRLLAEFHQIIPKHLDEPEPNSVSIEWICPHCLWYDSNPEGFKKYFGVLMGHDMIRENPHALFAIREKASLAFMPSTKKHLNRKFQKALVIIQ